MKAIIAKWSVFMHVRIKQHEVHSDYSKKYEIQIGYISIIYERDLRPWKRFFSLEISQGIHIRYCRKDKKKRRKKNEIKMNKEDKLIKKKLKKQ